MKTIQQLTLTFLAFAALGASPAKADAPARATGGVVTMFLRSSPEGCGNTSHMITSATPPDTLLYGCHSGGKAITAPDGHQITLGEYSTAQMSASAKCAKKGTHVSIQTTGLIPNGVYTIWVLVFNGPFDPSFSTLVGVGALGMPDGSQNSFQASDTGEGEINVIMQASTLSAIPYHVTNCLLDEKEVHLVGVYHPDGKTNGGTPGYPFGAEVQFGALIKMFAP